MLSDYLHSDAIALIEAGALDINGYNAKPSRNKSIALKSKMLLSACFGRERLTCKWENDHHRRGMTKNWLILHEKPTDILNRIVMVIKWWIIRAMMKYFVNGWSNWGRNRNSASENWQRKPGLHERLSEHGKSVQLCQEQNTWWSLLTITGFRLTTF